MKENHTTAKAIGLKMIVLFLLSSTKFLLAKEQQLYKIVLERVNRWRAKKGKIFMNFVQEHHIIPTSNRTIVFSFLLIFFSVSTGWGETYYVKTDGNDNLDGLSDKTAWATIAKVTDTVMRGDTVYFRSQDIWEDDTPPVLQATPGVIYNGDTYGSGTRATFKATGGYPNINYPNSYDAVVNLYASDVIFKGFEVDGNTQELGGIYVGMHAESDIANITVDNCVVHDNGGDDELGTVYVYGIHVGSNMMNSTTVSNVTITNTEVFNTSHEGIAIYPTWGYADNSVNGVLVRNCIVHDTALFGGDSWGDGISVVNNADNVTIEHCTVYDAYRGIGIITSSTYTGSPNSLVVRNNIIRDNSFGIAINPVSGMDADGVFYGNLIINNYRPSSLGSIGADINISAEIRRTSYNDTVFSFYNNTIYNVGSQLAGKNVVLVAEFYSITQGTPTFNFKNNIVYTGNYPAIKDKNNYLTHSNNLIYRSSDATDTAIINSTYSTSIPSTSVRVSNDATYTYFTKNDDTDWTSIIGANDRIKWSGFASSMLNDKLIYVRAVTANQIKTWRIKGDYTDTSIVTGEVWKLTNYNRDATIVWESTAQNSDPLFTKDAPFPNKFIRNNNDNMVPNTNYFSISFGPAIDTGEMLDSPYDGCINGTGAGLCNEILRPQGESYDIGAYEYPIWGFDPNFAQ